MKKLLFGLCFVTALSLCNVVQAEYVIELGTFRNTSAAQAGQWQVKYLGGPNISYPDGSFYTNEFFDWAGQRSYTNGTLNFAAQGYSTAMTIPTGSLGYEWNANLDWITSPYTPSGSPVPKNHNGYYSYATVIQDTFSSNAMFNALKLAYTSDDHIHAIFVNGVQLVIQGLPQSMSHFGWLTGYTNVMLSDITNWNVNGNNTVEFIVHNNNSNNLVGGGSNWANDPNATGFSGSIQAIYLSDNPGGVPEPATLLLWTLGGMGLAGTSWVRKRRMKKLATA